MQFGHVHTGLEPPYRDVSHHVFQANGVTVWQWFAEIEQPTPPCGMCVALHGRTYPIATALATHPGCRCLAVPVLTLATPPLTLGGQAWIDGQDAATQRAVLGPCKLAHYTAGALTLDAHSYQANKTPGRSCGNMLVDTHQYAATGASRWVRYHRSVRPCRMF